MFNDERVTENFKSIEYFKKQDDFVKKIHDKGRPLRWYIDKELAHRNQAIRDILNRAYKNPVYVSITSGARTAEYNQQLKDRGYNASDVSQHMFQRATDIQAYYFNDNGDKVFIPSADIIEILKNNFKYGAYGAVNEYTVHHDTRNADGWVEIKY